MSRITINKKHTASFDVDAQKTFTPLCPDELPVPDGENIVAALNQQALFAALRIGSKDAHSPAAIWVANAQYPVFSQVTGEHVDIRWPVHAVPGTVGFELLDGLPHPSAYDFFVWKGVEPDMHPYGACYHDLNDKLSTGVIEYLRGHDIYTVIVGGLAFDYCVKTTALQLAAAGFKVMVNMEATRAIAEDSAKQARSELEAVGIMLVDKIDKAVLEETQKT